MAEGLCRILPPWAALFLIDPDRVEERNLLRQNFAREELGQFKSEALALRLAKRYGRPVAYTILPVGLAEVRSALVIGCVDNGPARGGISGKSYTWWIDAGNGENYGQILIGNALPRSLDRGFHPNGICSALPLPTIQRPELLAQMPPRRDCAGAVEVGEQGPAINQAMAALVVEVTRRIIEGTCSWMQLYLDLEAGSLRSVPATPETVARITGIRISRLIEKPQSSEKTARYR